MKGPQSRPDYDLKFRGEGMLRDNFQFSPEAYGKLLLADNSINIFQDKAPGTRVYIVAEPGNEGDIFKGKHQNKKFTSPQLEDFLKAKGKLQEKYNLEHGGDWDGKQVYVVTPVVEVVGDRDIPGEMAPTAEESATDAPAPAPAPVQEEVKEEKAEAVLENDENF